MRRRLWNTCLVSPTHLSLLLQGLSAPFLLNSFTKGPDRIQTSHFSPVPNTGCVYPYIYNSYPEPRSKQEKKKPKSKQAAELCASGKCWERAGPSRGLGKQCGTRWGFCSRAEHSAGENRISWGMEPILPRSLVLQHPQSTGKRQQPCQQWDGSGAELLPAGYRDSSPADLVTRTPGMGQACLPGDVLTVPGNWSLRNQNNHHLNTLELEDPHPCSGDERRKPK